MQPSSAYLPAHRAVKVYEPSHRAATAGPKRSDGQPLAVALTVAVLIACVCAIALGVTGNGTYVTAVKAQFQLRHAQHSSSLPAAAAVSITPPGPARVTRDGVIYRVQQVPVTAVTLDAADPQQLDVWVFQPIPAGTTCDPLTASVRVVRQTSTAVEIAAFGYRNEDGITGGKAPCADETAGEQGLYQRATVSLEQPLGARQVVDATSRQVAALLDDHLIKSPTYLPPHYVLHSSTDFGAKSSFVATREYEDGVGAIDVRAMSATVWHRSGQLAATTTVSGRAAVVTNEKTERCVSWHDQPGLVREVCSLGPNGDYLAADQLMRIAASLQ